MYHGGDASGGAHRGNSIKNVMHSLAVAGKLLFADNRDVYRGGVRLGEGGQSGQACTCRSLSYRTSARRPCKTPARCLSAGTGACWKCMISCHPPLTRPPPVCVCVCVAFSCLSCRIYIPVIVCVTFSGSNPSAVASGGLPGSCIIVFADHFRRLSQPTLRLPHRLLRVGFFHIYLS